MATNNFDVVDYLAQARSRYTEQFKGKPFYDAYLKVVLDAFNELESTFKDLMQLRSLDTATGVQLDQIGAIVGQSRVLVDYTAFPFFGFNGASGAETFGSISNANGGVFRSKNQASGAPSTVDDDTYRFLIKARIKANNSNATPEDILSGLAFITGSNSIVLEELGDAKLRLTLPDTLTDLQKYFLQGLSSIGSIVPVPIGVSVEYVFV